MDDRQRQRRIEYWKTVDVGATSAMTLNKPLAVDDAVDIKQALLLAAAPTNDPESLAKALIAAFAIVDSETKPRACVDAPAGPSQGQH